MSFLSSSSSSSVLRFSTRIALAILIPGAVIAWLLYSASQQQAYVEARNMRWLGQMASQIQNLVRNQNGIVQRSLDSGDNPYAIAEDNVASAKCVAEWKHLSVVDGGEGPKLRFRLEEDAKSECAQSDLTRLVERSVRQGVFDSIVLAQRNGPVLYQSNPDLIRLTNVQFLFAPAPDSKLGLPIFAAEKPADNPDQKPEAAAEKSAPTATMHLTRSIGDRKFSVTVQPLRLLLAGAGAVEAEGDWLLIGLSDGSSSWRRSTPHSLIVILPLILILVLVSWPLPRPWYLPPTEPLRRRDLMLIGICTVVVLVILAMLGLFHSQRTLADARTDQRLQRFTNSIGSNLKYELTLGIRQLQELDTLAATENSKEDLKPKLFESLCPDKIYTRFEYVDWIDPDGIKKVRWTPKAEAARKVKVADRNYFRSVMAKRMLSMPMPDGSKASFAIEQVLSRTTGRFITMVAIESKRPKDTAPVASIGLSLASVLSTSLPRDFGFAIIEPDGKVIFHSEPSRALVENFFEECQDAPELKGAVERRVEAFLDSNYSGSPHRLLVTPIPGLEQMPWTIVAFRSLDPIRVNRLQGLAGAIALFLCYAFVLILISALILFLAPPVRRRVIPRSIFDLRWWSRGTSSYPAVAVAGFVLLVIFWRAIHRLNGPDLFYVAVGTALSFLVISSIGLRRPRGTFGSRSVVGWLGGVAAVLVVFALLLGDWTMAILAPAITLAAGYGFSHPWQAAAPTLSRRLQLAGWMAWTAQIALCLIIGPAFAVGQCAWAYESGLYVRDLQWNLQRSEASRRRELVQEITGLPGVKQCDRLRQRLLGAVGLNGKGACPPLYFYGEPGFRTLIWPPQASATDPASPCPLGGEKGCAAGSVSPEPPCSARAAEAVRPGPFDAQSQSPWKRLEAGLPAFVLASVEVPFNGLQRGFSMRLSEMRPAGRLWDWHETGAGRSHYLWLSYGENVVARSSPPSFIPLDLFSPARWRAGDVVELWVAFQFWAGLVIVLAILLWWVIKLLSRVLLLNVRPEQTLKIFDERADAATPRLFLLAPPGGAAGALPPWAADFHLIDFATLPVPAAGGATPELPDGNLFFHHLESRFGDEASRLARLDLLEAAMRVGHRRIFVVSTIDPVYYLRTGAAGSLGQQATPPELARWRRVMSYFPPRVLPPAARPAFVDYSSIWESCSYQEKLVLSQLAEHRLINPTAGSIAHALLTRSLIRRRPSLRFDFCSTAFQNFVRAMEMHPEASESGLPAKRAGLPPYAIALVLFGVIMFFSQEEITSRLIGFLTTLTGGFEAIRRQIGAAGGDASKEKK